MSVSSDILSSSVSKASKRSKETETGPAFMTIVKKKKEINCDTTTTAVCYCILYLDI